MLVRNLTLVLALLLAAESATRADTPRPLGDPPPGISPEAWAIHASALVIDGHNDLPWQIHERGGGDPARLDISQPQPTIHTDLPRLRAGGVGALFLSAYVPVEAGLIGEAAAQTFAQLDLIDQLVARYPDALELARTAADVERIHAAGRISALIGIEGGHAIENSLATLERFFARGARYLTLTHSRNTDWADSATDAPQSQGLAPFGIEVVKTCNRLGMLVDISHVSVETMLDAIHESRAPVIASHSSAFALAPHPRNVPDEVLKLIRAHDGLVMVNFYSGYVVAGAAQQLAELGRERLRRREKVGDKADAGLIAEYRRIEAGMSSGTVATVVDHIEHVIRVAGIDHVGLGSDFDGVGKLPEGLADVSAYPRITQELWQRGYTAEQIHKVLGGNLLRIMRAAEIVAQGRPRPPLPGEAAAPASDAEGSPSAAPIPPPSE